MARGSRSMKKPRGIKKPIEKEDHDDDIEEEEDEDEEQEVFDLGDVIDEV